MAERAANPLLCPLPWQSWSDKSRPNWDEDPWRALKWSESGRPVFGGRVALLEVEVSSPVFSVALSL